jgi:hypothetical protein
MNCKFCDREINNKGSLAAHQLCCKMNPEKVKFPHSEKAGQKKGSIPWNKGKTGFKSWNKGLTGLKGCTHTEEFKQKLSDLAKKKKLGGYVEGSGRGKKGWYKGFFCDSSWELAYVIFCLDHSIKIERNSERRTYEWSGEIRNYIPDFLVDGILVEIKGFKTPQWEAKLIANPDVKVLYEDDMKSILDYVTQKYGKKFIELYE